MSPDVEWRVSDGANQETIARTAPSTPSRWRRLIIALAVIFGAGLGVLYMAIPEPPKLPTPTPAPTDRPPPPLDPVVEREARSLATGNQIIFLSLQDQVDGGWYHAQQTAFKPWGQPSSSGPLYTILAQGTLDDGRAWADVSQWRGEGVYFRETRFYRLRDSQWKRTRPDQTFWAGKQQTDLTTHFRLFYPSEDRSIARDVTQRFERVYDVLCRDLNCPSRNNQGERSTLIFQSGDDLPSFESGHGFTITLPSPRLIGYYQGMGTADDQFTALAYQYILPIVLRAATNNAARWRTNQAGDWLMQGIGAWEMLRIKLARATPPERIRIYAPGELWPGPSQGDPTATQEFYRDLLSDVRIVAPTTLWNRPSDSLLPSDQFDVIDGEIDAVVAYLEEIYGPVGVVQLLNALGPAQSLPDAIEAAYGVSYVDFEQQWLKWIGR